MIRICRALEILQVAGHACRAGQVVVIVNMAVRALPRGHCVRVGQRKPYCGVIELSIQPVVRTVALVAGCPELRGNVVWIRRDLKVRRVTRVTVRRHGLELAVGRALVAGIAIYCGVRPSERKAIIMLLHLLDRNGPSPHSVALFAVGAELPFVNVRMAVLATQPHIRKHRLHVTLRASYSLMHTAQGIAGLVVIEFRDGANRPPRIRRVTILARNIQIAVWAVRTPSSLRNGT